jgi:hypothetical protein
MLRSEVVYRRTRRLTVVVFVMPPPVPVMVMTKRPAVLPELAVTCIVDVPEPGAGMDVGVKLTVTPLG